MSILLITPYEMSLRIANQARAKRLTMNLSQKTVAERSGVSYGTLKKFERTGQISLESLLKLALPLDALDDFKDLFLSLKPQVAISLDELMQDNKRKRGRK